MWSVLHIKINEVSGLTDAEYVLFLASLEARLKPDKFSCTRCAAKYKPQHREAKRKSKGCYDYSTKVYRLDNVVYKTCLGNYNKDINFFIEAFSLYEKGVLPFKGTLSDQPSKVIDIFNIIEQRRAESKES